MATARANQIDIEYETFGDPAHPAMLLIMGLGAQMIVWPDEFCHKLALNGFHVIRFDNRDVGLSTKFYSAQKPFTPLKYAAYKLGLTPSSPYSLDDMADDAIGLLDALNIQRAHVIGASMGGMIAQLLTHRYAERVASLTCIMSSSGDPSLPGPELSLVMQMSRKCPQGELEHIIRCRVSTLKRIISTGYPASDEELAERVRRSYARSDYTDGYFRQLAAILACGSRVKLLRNIRTPALVIHGAADPLIPVQAGIDLARHLKGSRLEVIEGMGHDLPSALIPELTHMIVDHARKRRDTATPDPTPALQPDLVTA